jgi:O-antigen/teichoic acid export membrane protein
MCAFTPAALFSAVASAGFHVAAERMLPYDSRLLIRSVLPSFCVFMLLRMISDGQGL